MGCDDSVCREKTVFRPRGGISLKRSGRAVKRKERRKSGGTRDSHPTAIFASCSQTTEKSAKAGNFTIRYRFQAF
jgi:hypothetical protein